MEKGSDAKRIFSCVGGTGKRQPAYAILGPASNMIQDEPVTRLGSKERTTAN
jgi:hypothetical protein